MSEDVKIPRPKPPARRNFTSHISWLNAMRKYYDEWEQQAKELKNPKLRAVKALKSLEDIPEKGSKRYSIVGIMQKERRLRQMEYTPKSFGRNYLRGSDLVEGQRKEMVLRSTMSGKSARVIWDVPQENDIKLEGYCELVEREVDPNFCNNVCKGC